ncbi:bifunctional pyr operon transcriptional regulator/uracil phosphoribosyltransferase PyrR [Hyphobacterium sp. CCMP332]|nr:bifunctional pyr operon transcriptional regulator/uracil phosphoribosyltransferase PyrR [Hyphobacterium sp. CCMP332]
MEKRCILDTRQLNITLSRLCQELIENYSNFEDTVILGMQPRGTLFASRIQKRIKDLLDKEIALGQLDVTFYRDDFRRKSEPIKASSTEVPFLIENKHVILVDDVLFTGRSVRAALDAMIAFGRPKSVELMILINRKNSQELPIKPDYIGRTVNTLNSQRVKVQWDEKDIKNKVWLIDLEEE